jgi:uncharacterized phiE125 gp8 family phage protein
MSGHYDLTLDTPPSAPPTDAQEGKKFCRIDLAEDDRVVNALIAGAAERVIKVAGRALVTQTWLLRVDSFCCEVGGTVVYHDCRHGWTLSPPLAPLQSVTWIKYYDTSGVQQTLDPARYVVCPSVGRGRIVPAYGTIWPTAQSRPQAVEVKFVAGYGLAAAVPSEIKARIWNYVAYCYRNRQEIDEDYLDTLFRRFWTGVN